MSLSVWGHGALAGGKQGGLCGQSVTTAASEKKP